MNFYDFDLLFKDYKKRVKELNKNHSLINILINESIPLSRIVLVSLLLIDIMFMVAFALTKNQFGTMVVFFVAIFILVVDYLWNSNLNNLEYKEYYKKYVCTKRNILITILKEYGITVYDEKIIDSLIIEAEHAQRNSDYFLPIKESFKNISTIVLAMLSFIAGRFGDMLTLRELIIGFCYAIGIILLTVLPFYTIKNALKGMILSDYKLLDQFIYDLRQIEIVERINKNNEKGCSYCRYCD